ncbi:tetratricopeptide repeat protein [Streptomyces sp. NPDC008079]|uniref:tetratricopeptide repeat protein n=1 Tax=Streptomyces sp. NPDC008079 TaxID=3364806 RepID=UPI0036F1724E
MGGAVVVVLACAAGLLAFGRTAPAHRGAPGLDASPPGAVGQVDTARAAVRARPKDAAAWSQLGLAEVEQARTTMDGRQLTGAATAFRRSFALRPKENYDAVAGSGMLANARHDFGAARDLGRRATAMAPDRATGYAVLADAYIQLGDYPAATDAAQRLLDLAPATAGYTRAAYDLETHGRTADAAIALQRALDTAAIPADTAFCEHRLGDLAWDSGDVAAANTHYRRALAASPGDYYARIGQARTDVARGRTARALAGYAAVADRVPLPQFLLEYAELQQATGHRQDAEAQLAALAGEVRLLRASGGPVDPYLALYQADHADPAVAVALLRGEWSHRHSVLVADALGWALHRTGRDAEALVYARRAAATGWHSALFVYHRGAVEAALGLPRAAADLRAALRINPHFSALHAPLAVRLLEREPRAS